MLKSIKSKILVLTFGILCLLAIIITGVASVSFYSGKEMTVAARGLAVSSLAESVNKEIIKLEKNALDLALIGEVHYKAGKQEYIAKELLTGIFLNYPDSLGGGIWFVPYIIQPNKQRSCMYAFRSKDGGIVVDNAYESAEYNYLKQSWYTEIMAELKKGAKLFWSKPYYENIGAKTLMTTVGAGIYIDGKLIGMSTVDWKMDSILSKILEIKPTAGSFVLFADKVNDYIIAGTEPGVDENNLMGKSLQVLPWYSASLQEGKMFKYNGKKYIPYIKQLDNGMFLIVNVPIAEMFSEIVHHLTILLLLLLISVFIISGILYFVLQRNINKPIMQLSQMAQLISKGHIDTKIHLEEPLELAHLATVFNKMTKDIKKHITQLSKFSSEKERMEAELAIAYTIQKSAMPHDFPQNDYIDLSASMDPAREVGGDFYDFFPIDDKHTAFVMADVSGKGITAAMYMMSAKTAIKNMLQAGYPLAEAIKRANNNLCENSVQSMFVTAFIGVLDLSNGKVSYINAGHCIPLRQSESGCDFIDTERSLVLGFMPSYTYKVNEFTLKPKDKLFLYTDGVTEAQNKKGNMFGDKRLKKVLSQATGSASEILETVNTEIGKFVKGAEQFDDTTMMIIEFKQEKRD